MTANGDVPSGAGGVNEPDWIDQILERATQQVDSLTSERRGTPLPIVPEPAPAPVMPAGAEPTPAPVMPAGAEPTPAPVMPASAEPAPAPVMPASAKPTPAPVDEPRHPTDQLAEIRWAEEPQVTPASTPIVRVDGNSSGVAASGMTAPGMDSVTRAPEPRLTAQDVGKSAWDDELASVGDGDPEGWDKLSWQDLDGKPKQTRELHPSNDFASVIREWGPVLFMAVAIALFIRLVIVQAYHIPSPSMVPTLEEGDRVVVNRLSYRFGEIDRGQVIVFEKPPNSTGENDLIKRVLALPGETIRFVDNDVYIDGLRVEEPYLLRPDSTRPLRDVIPGCAQDVAMNDSCQVPLGYVFVMGDNRESSSDSRVFGPIPVDTVVGRAFLKVWPLNDLGQL